MGEVLATLAARGSALGSGAAVLLVELGNNGVANALELLVLLIEHLLVGLLVEVEPVESVLDGIEDGLLVVLLNLGAKLVLVLDGRLK